MRNTQHLFGAAFVDSGASSPNLIAWLLNLIETPPYTGPHWGKKNFSADIAYS